MSASAHHPPWGRASDTDRGGTGTRQLQGAWARKRENGNVNYHLSLEEVETLVYDNIGVSNDKLVWFDDSYFRTLMFGVEPDLNTINLKLGGIEDQSLSSDCRTSNVAYLLD